MENLGFEKVSAGRCDHVTGPNKALPLVGNGQSHAMSSGRAFAKGIDLRALESNLRFRRPEK